jgi:hypothetical protein
MAAGGQRRLVPLPITLITLALAQLATAQAQINFRDIGAFENCLEAAFGKWAREQAELQVNDDPSAQTLEDRRVAAWTGTTIEDCRKHAGNGDTGAEVIFLRHMSHWRRHVFDLASSIRRRGQSD